MTEVGFYVWITVVTDSYAEQVVGRLVRRNWKVVALGNTLSLRNDDNLAVLIAFAMSKAPKDAAPENELNQSKALEEVKDVLKRLDVKYYTLVVAQQPVMGCTWCLGNVTRSAIEKEQIEQKKSVN